MEKKARYQNLGLHFLAYLFPHTSGGLQDGVCVDGEIPNNSNPLDIPVWAGWLREGRSVAGKRATLLFSCLVFYHYIESIACLLASASCGLPTFSPQSSQSV
jgi:hypothetical protein